MGQTTRFPVKPGSPAILPLVLTSAAPIPGSAVMRPGAGYAF
jgi:hypothetical protein